MFPVKAKTDLPVEKLVIHSVAVRGHLGPMSVWVTNGDEEDREHIFRLDQRYWNKIYQRTHPPSPSKYQRLNFSRAPIVLRPGQIRHIYIHSALPNDRAIVYDNSNPLVRNRPRYEDAYISILKGRAHLSPTPFGELNVWGWHTAWRDHREFVGQMEYGCIYKLWNPEMHGRFGHHFQRTVQLLLACQRRTESPVSLLPDECLYYILNMCRWDWFQDTAEEMSRPTRLSVPESHLGRGMVCPICHPPRTTTSDGGETNNDNEQQQQQQQQRAGPLRRFSNSFKRSVQNLFRPDGA